MRDTKPRGRRPSSSRKAVSPLLAPSFECRKSTKGVSPRLKGELGALTACADKKTMSTWKKAIEVMEFVSLDIETKHLQPSHATEIARHAPKEDWQQRVQGNGCPGFVPLGFSCGTAFYDAKRRMMNAIPPARRTLQSGQCASVKNPVTEPLVTA